MLKTTIVTISDHAAIKSSNSTLILSLEQLKVLRDQIDEAIDTIHLERESN